MQVQTAQQRAGAATVALETALVDATKKRHDEVHAALFHTPTGRRLLAVVRAGAAAKSTEPTGFADSTTDASQQLSDALQSELEQLLRKIGLSPDGISYVVQRVGSQLGVERLGDWLADNASGNVLDGNSATAGGLGASASRRGSREGDEALDDYLSAVAQRAKAERVLHGTQAPPARAPAPAPAPRPSAPPLDLRAYSGPNVTARALAKVQAENPRLDYDSAWMQACQLVHDARAAGRQVLT